MQTASESVPARSSLLPARPRRRRPAKSKYLGRTAGEGKILRWFAIVLVSGKGHGDSPPWARGANGAHATSGSFGAACASAASAAGTRWLSALSPHRGGGACVTPGSAERGARSPAAGWLGSGRAAPRRERGWRAARGSCRLIRALPCGQPKRKFPLIQPVRLAALPQQSPVLLLEIEIRLETPSS